MRETGMTAALGQLAASVIVGMVARASQDGGTRMFGFWVSGWCAAFALVLAGRWWEGRTDA